MYSLWGPYKKGTANIGQNKTNRKPATSNKPFLLCFPVVAPPVRLQHSSHRNACKPVVLKNIASVGGSYGSSCQW